MSAKFTAIEAKLGNTRYYLLTMKAGELVKRCHLPLENDETQLFDTRAFVALAPKLNRVKSKIVPYLADDDRFFGSIILGAPDLTFRSGQITLGDADLHPLDGRHRLVAIQFAIEGKDERKKTTGKPNLALANDDIPIILVHFNPAKPESHRKMRKLFTKINSDARKPASQVHMMDDSEPSIVVAHEVADLINEGHALVSTAQDSLHQTGHFTTLNTIAKSVDAILEAHFPEVKLRELPDDETMRKYKTVAREVWDCLLKNISLFKDALSDRSPAGDARRREIRTKYLLGMPLLQQALVQALVDLTNSKADLTMKQAARNLDQKICWKKSHPFWDTWLFTGSKKSIRHHHLDLAAKIFRYLAGEALDRDKLLEEYLKCFPRDTTEQRAIRAQREKRFSPTMSCECRKQGNGVCDVD